MRAHLPGPGLYALTPDWDDTALMLERAEALIAGGAVMLQYRHSGASARTQRAQAGALRQLCARHAIPFIVNDSVALCLEVDADGVHLGRDNTPIAEARARLGAGRIIGATCYDQLERAHAAAADGADYVAFGGFYRSSRKDYAPTTPMGLIDDAVATLPLPVAAIGGMSPRNCAPLIARGARWIAAIGSVFDTPDSEHAARLFKRLFAIAGETSTL
jgi:thiamine-phosphate pyrophosphorylase